MKSVFTSLIAISILIVGASASVAQGRFKTGEPAQIRGDTESTNVGWEVEALLTIGEVWQYGKGFRPGENVVDVLENTFGYRPPGILDGMAAFPRERSVRILANHELRDSQGYPYRLANGTELTGARVSYFDIDKRSRSVSGMGLAFDTIFDRAGDMVTDPEQLGGGIHRLCSSYGVEAGRGGFEADVYFTGEETGGGTEFVLDVDGETLYAAPMLGVAAWENVCPVENFASNKVVIIIGDDRGGAPLLLYVGEKGVSPSAGYAPPGFLVENGLGMGRLFTWVANDPAMRSPEDFSGTGNSLGGKFVPIAHFDPSLAGTTLNEELGLAYDELGFVNQALQDALSFGAEETDEDGNVVYRLEGAGAFKFSRPEDVSGNPDDFTQIILASTGRGSLFPADDWGTMYIIDFDDDALEELLEENLADIDFIPARISILYDGDDAGGGQVPGPDFGLRSPDNLDWADDGFIYIQEDRSTGLFGVGGTERDGDVVVGSGVEASVWRLDPSSGELLRILEMDRTAVPIGQADPVPFDIGNWESSGILDVTELFPTHRGETLLILNTQAHSLQGGGLAIAANQSSDLVQGGQLVLASKRDGSGGRNDVDDEEGDEND